MNQMQQLECLCAVGFNMVARFGMFHRSLYPALRVARGHYVFCSHVGQPLSVWDHRYRCYITLKVACSPRTRLLT